MKKFVPYEKMSKKQRRALDRQRRGSWQGISPVTRIAETDKTRYSRKIKHKNGSGDFGAPLPFVCRERGISDGYQMGLRPKPHQRDIIPLESDDMKNRANTLFSLLFAYPDSGGRPDRIAVWGRAAGSLRRRSGYTILYTLLMRILFSVRFLKAFFIFSH